mgnify:CR=1 FL=1|jgi:hypothetical protein
MQDKKAKLQTMEKGLGNSIIELENSWIIIGGWLYNISQLIDAENDQSTEWKSITGYTSFSNYLVEKWNYSNPHKGFKERSAFKNLIENKPALLEKYKSNKSMEIPGFTLLSLLESYKESMNDIEWKSLLEKVYLGGLSRKELENLNPKKVRKSSNSSKVDDDSKNDSYESPYKYFDESFNDEELVKINNERKSILLVELPDLKEKVINLFPGEQSETILSLIEKIEDELRLITTTKVAA